MTYSIQAVIAAQGTFPVALPDAIVVLRLDCGMEIIPLCSLTRKQYGIPFLPLTDEGNVELPAVLQDLCSKLAACGRVAYIEAEFFGGSGTQAHVLIAKPDADALVTISDNAINQALRWLGLNPLDGKDEFATVGLGKHRETDLWLRHCRL